MGRRKIILKWGGERKTTTMSDFETIIYKKKNSLAYVTLNRPHALNAYNLKMRDELYQVLAAIKALRPDLIAVAAYGQWIPESVFNLPPKRSLNLHPSLLPLHRGAAPVVSAILAGDNQVGLSVLFVEDEMDVGDLLAQMSVPIEEDDTTGVVMAKLAKIGAPFFIDTLADWVAGKITPKPQDHALATWIDRLKKEEGLIDWTWSAAKIARRCRALSPWPGTCTFFEGRRLLIPARRLFPFRQRPNLLLNRGRS